VAPQAEHPQNHLAGSRAEAVAVAAGVVPAIDVVKPPKLVAPDGSPVAFLSAAT